MDGSILLVLSVTELGRSSLGVLPQKFVVAATLDSTIHEVKQLVWLNSSNHCLSPETLTIKYQGSIVQDDSTLASIAEQFTYDFELIVDSNLIPQYSKQVERFPIKIRLVLDSDEPLEIDLTLDSTVSDVKDAFLRNHYQKFHQFLLRQKVAINYLGVPLNDDHRLHRALKIDVPPHRAVEMSATVAGAVNVSRFHINVKSQIDQLQHANLFEVTKFTTFSELKKKIIDLIDETCVIRTFPEQITFSMDGQIIDTLGDQSAIFNVLQLSDEKINQNNGIIELQLDVSKELNNGSLSTGFVSELRNHFANLGSVQPMSQNNTQELNGNQPEQPVAEIESITGETRERIIPQAQQIPFGQSTENRELLVQSNQPEPRAFYDVSLKLGDEIVSVSLDTSECIIVDNPNHEPYLLVNPSGAAKLHNHIKLPAGESLIQKVQVIKYEEPRIEPNAFVVENNNVHPINIDNERNVNINGNGHRNRTFLQFLRELYNRFGPLGNRILLIALKFLVFINIINVNIPWRYWKFIAMYAAVLVLLYSVFIGGVRIAEMVEGLLPPPEDNQPRPLHETVILKISLLLSFTSASTSAFFLNVGKDLIAGGVRRPYDFERILSNDKKNWWLKWNDTINYAMKDTLLFVLTLSPRMTDLIEEEIVTWRNGEIEAFQIKIKLFEDLVKTLIDEYNQKFIPEFTLPEAISRNIELVVSEIQDESDKAYCEDRYRLMIDMYKALEKSYNVLNKSFVTNTPVGEGRVRENIDNENNETLHADNGTNDNSNIDDGRAALDENDVAIENIGSHFSGSTFTTAASRLENEMESQEN